MAKRKILIMGLDCVTPQFLFQEYIDSLPNINSLLKKSVWGKLKSTIPPITCPAWLSMITGKNPGRLGCYGLRNRTDYSYGEMSIMNSTLINEDTLFDILSRENLKVVSISVPPSYPPRPINGYMVGGFLTPDINTDFTYPREFKYEIKKRIGDYIVDVENFRTEDKESLLKQIYDMTTQKFRLVKYILKEKEWDLFMFVEMGPDRIHHGFWKFVDKAHKKYTPDNKYENSIQDYYRFLDSQVGEVVKLLDKDTTLFIVSDHGAKRLDGGFCINEWLIKEGYLKLKKYPDKITTFNKDLIDWGATSAWGEGGYYCRLFLNLKGREPDGIIPQDKYEEFRDELINKLLNIKYDHKNIKTKVFKPQDVYDICKGIPPDLIIYFGNLFYRSIASIGYRDIFTSENDTGPDDSNHDEYGIFIMYEPGMKKSVKADNLTIYDIAPTVLHKIGLEVPKDMEGRILSCEY